MAGIEPPCDSGVSDKPICDCVNSQHPRAAHALHSVRANQHESTSNGTHCQSVHLPPAVMRIAEFWSSLPPHIRETITTLVDASAPKPPVSNAAGSPDLSKDDRSQVGLDDLARRLAKECRHVVQGCLREEEWRDADEEFLGIIAAGLQLPMKRSECALGYEIRADGL